MSNQQPKNLAGKYDFDNGYGASVIMNEMSYGGKMGLYEIAVLHSGLICYDTDITDDVLGFLTKSAVNDILEKISNLSPKT